MTHDHYSYLVRQLIFVGRTPTSYLALALCCIVVNSFIIQAPEPASVGLVNIFGPEANTK